MGGLQLLLSLMDNQYFGFLLLIMLALAISIIPLPTFNFLDQNISLYIISALPYFCVGSAFGLIFTHSIKQSKFISNFWGLSIFIILLIYPQIHEHIFNNSLDLWGNIFVLLSVSVFFYTVVFLTPSHSIIYGNMIGDFLGKVSYSMYLWHLPILFAIKPIAREYKLLTFPFFLLAVIFVSGLSYYVIENPMRKLIRHHFMRK